MSTTAWSLDKWAATHAPLDDAQRSSCTRLTVWQNRHPSVWHQTHDQPTYHPTPGGPLEQQLEQQQQQQQQQVDSEPLLNPAPAPAPSLLEQDKQAVVQPATLTLPDRGTSDSLAAWLQSLSAHKLSAREADLQSSLANVSQALAWTDTVLDTATSAETQIKLLSQLSTDVRTSTTPIRASSSAAVDALDRLASLSESLAERKAYFDLLTPITRLLSSPSPDLALVSSPEFQAAWTKIDQGLQFTSSHPQYAESTRYKTLFEHSAVRAASLVRMWLGRYVQTWTDHAARTLSHSRGEKAEMLSDPVVKRAVFGAEGTQATLVRSLFKHLEDRSPLILESTEKEQGKVGIAEIRPILDECHTTLFSARGAFLTPVFAALLGDVASNAPSPAVAFSSFSSSSSSAATSQRRTSTDTRLAALWAILHAATEVVQQESDAVRSLLGVDRAQQAYDAHLVATFDLNVSRATKVAVQTIVPPGKTSAEEVLRTLVPFLRSLSSSLPTDHRAEVKMHVYQPAMDSVRSVVLRALEGKVRAIAAYVPRPGDLAYPERILRTRSSSGQTLSKDSSSTLTLPSGHARGQSIGGSGVLDAATISSSSSPSLSNKQEDAEGAKDEARLFVLPPGEEGETLAGTEVSGTWYAPFKSAFVLLGSTWDVLDPDTLVQASEQLSVAVLQALRAGAAQLAHQSSSSKPSTLSTPSKEQVGPSNEGQVGAAQQVELGDATLFLLRHVLLLRETIASVHVALSRLRSFHLGSNPKKEPEPVRTLDLGVVVGTLQSLWSGTFWSSSTASSSFSSIPAPSQASTKQKHAGTDQAQQNQEVTHEPLELELQAITTRLVDRTCLPFSIGLTGSTDPGTATTQAQLCLDQAQTQLDTYLDDPHAAHTLVEAAAEELQRRWSSSRPGATPLPLRV